MPPPGFPAAGDAMSTRIVDLELTEPLPASIDSGKCDRLLIILWSAGAPVGTREIRAVGGRVDRLQLAAALGCALGEKAQDAADETGAGPGRRRFRLHFRRRLHLPPPGRPEPLPGSAVGAEASEF